MTCPHCNDELYNGIECLECGYTNELQQDAEALNYFYDEILCNCDDSDKGEVFDADCWM